jgi:hypothetical protein
MAVSKIRYCFREIRGRRKTSMGNFNSGRRGARPTSDATQSLVLEMASLTRAGLEPGLLARTTLHYGEEHFPVELTIDTRGENAGFIDFAHDTRNTRSPERISYRIWLNWSQPHYGGRRYWFCCPGTGKRAAKLFLPRGGHQFLSREAYRLGYACQRETRTDRLMRKARRLHRELGGKGDPLEEDAPEKP